MRINQPVTHRERTFDAEERLISTTDLKGVIESANDAFVRVSGFSRDELTGSPHNLVRHPDMPEAVYEDFWSTLQSGDPWLGVVKNRCKNGDHYWVSAFVSPVYRNGQHTGYQSVRMSPTEAQKRRAEILYARMRSGRPARAFWHFPGPRVKAAFCATLATAVGVSAGLLLGQGEAAAGAAAAAAGFGLAVAGTAAATGRLRRLSGAARAVFDNEVSRFTYGNGHDVVAEAELAMEMQQAQLFALRGRVADLTGSLATTARHSSEAADTGHQAIAGQEEEILQVVTAMEEMAATVQEVSRNTAETSSASLEVARQAESGRETIVRNAAAMRSLASEVGQGTEAMEQLREETRSIRKVLEVIDAIAAQTNLLALNAAIEAARAGESGRGFAVVATEVRELASRVSESTEDIGRMIQQLEERADGALDTMRRGQQSATVVAEEADESSRVIVEIERAVEQIRDMTMQIATATEQQTSTTDEINRRVSGVNEGLRSTAAVTSGTRETSNALLSVVEEIHDVVQQFRLGTASTRPPGA